MALAKYSDYDPVLLPYLHAADELLGEASLAELVCEQKETTINEIVRARLRVSLAANDGSHSNQEALELVTDVQATLLSTLRDLKQTPGAKPIKDVRAYVATVTYNACHQLLRRKYPKRFQLKNKLRYLLSHEPTFAVWESDGDWLCGLSDWQGSGRSQTAAAALQRFRKEPQHLQNAGLATQRRDALIDLLLRIFRTLGGAVLLDELVSLVAEHLQVKEDVLVADSEGSNSISKLADSAKRLESQAEIQKLWKEICALPLRHRCALLLNLRDRHGTDALEVFQIGRIATVRDLAAVLGFGPEEFAAIWHELPWDDLKIAKHLGLTRQQVINLRQSARARLARRFIEKGKSD